MARIAHILGEEWRSNDIELDEDKSFDSLLLSDGILHGLKSAGFVRPSPIQYQAIPLGRAGHDLIVQAKSGTGKTCVFAVVALERLLLESKATQALVLAPTREVAVQICQVVQGLGCGFKGLQCHAFIGGMPVSEDKTRLKCCHVAVGTPGRIKQLIRENILKTNSIRLFVLDEADKLLEEGFQESINWIYSSLPVRKQMLALSATYPEKLAELLQLYMNSPCLVRLSADSPALIGVSQFYCSTPYSAVQHVCYQAKINKLLSILKVVSFSQCLVFSNYQTRAESLSDVLKKHGWLTDHISGGQEQSQRLEAMDKLKRFKCRVFVSTDVSSRGIDAENVNLVINMDFPWELETYLHRIGRAGRFGTRGLAISFVSGDEETTLFHQIKEKGNLKIPVLPNPMPPDLWLYASQADMNESSSSEKADKCSASENGIPCESLPEEHRNERHCLVTGSDGVDQSLSERTAKICVSDTASYTENKDVDSSSKCTTGSERSVFAYEDLINDFSKSLQQVEISDNIDEQLCELDEETKLLLSLNSFLASNHEEFRLKLEDGFEKYDIQARMSDVRELTVKDENDEIQNHDNVNNSADSSVQNALCQSVKNTEDCTLAFDKNKESVESNLNLTCAIDTHLSNNVHEDNEVFQPEDKTERHFEALCDPSNQSKTFSHELVSNSSCRQLIQSSRADSDNYEEENFDTVLEDVIAGDYNSSLRDCTDVNGLVNGIHSSLVSDTTTRSNGSSQYHHCRKSKDLSPRPLSTFHQEKITEQRAYQRHRNKKSKVQSQGLSSSSSHTFWKSPDFSTAMSSNDNQWTGGSSELGNLPCQCSRNTLCYDSLLRSWWKPNTRMALTYLECNNYMSHLLAGVYKNT